MSRRLWLPEAGRPQAIHVSAVKGGGKTRVLSRTIGKYDFVQGKPVIIFDPTGDCTDNLIDAILRLNDDHHLSEEAQEAISKRISYVNTAGHYGSVVPFPLYYQRPGDTLRAQTRRLLDVLHRLDPWQDTASQYGWPALAECGEHIGMILAHLQLPIIVAKDILAEPDPWLLRIQNIEPLRDALAYLRRYKANPRERTRMAGSFLTKVNLFADDPMLAMFGLSQRGIEWEDVLAKKRCVLIDSRHDLKNPEALRLKLLWIYQDLLTVLRERPRARETPVSLIIDEAAFLLRGTGMQQQLLEDDLDELLNRISRSRNIQVTIAHQELYQLSPTMQHAFLYGMGTQIIGGTADIRSARAMAQRFYRYDPYLVRKREQRMQMVSMDAFYGSMYAPTEMTVEFTLPEQLELRAYEFMDLPKQTFLVAVAEDEGHLPYRLQRISTRGDDAGQYVNEDEVERVKRYLSRRDGVPITQALAEIQARRQALATQARRQPPAISAGTQRTAKGADKGTGKTSSSVADQAPTPTQLSLDDLPPPPPRRRR